MSSSLLKYFPKLQETIFSSQQKKYIFSEHKQKKRKSVTIQEFKRRKKEKKPTQVLQVINSEKIAAGILQAMSVASRNIFPDFTNL